MKELRARDRVFIVAASCLGMRTRGLRALALVGSRAHTLRVSGMRLLVPGPIYCGKNERAMEGASEPLESEGASP